MEFSFRKLASVSRFLFVFTGSRNAVYIVIENCIIHSVQSQLSGVIVIEMESCQFIIVVLRPQKLTKFNQ